MNTISSVLLITLLFTTSISTAHAYIGPGMGGGVVVAVLGILGAIFIGLFGIIYFPIKRAIQKKKAAKLANDSIDDEKAQDNSPGQDDTNKQELNNN